MLLIQRSSDPEEILLGEFDVIAAGAIPWRIEDGELQVLVIHRPRYDDWSWPKGKLDPGESIPECAVREVREEVGLTVRLGIPLEATAYTVNSKAKVVYYWAAQLANGAEPSVDGNECDEARWVGAKQAKSMLTNPTDSLPLDDLHDAHLAGQLETRSFMLVRHAKAKPRANWTREEGQRPLAATGRRQALAVARLLECWQPEHVATSPWLRCLQTITPYVTAHDIKPKMVNSMTEHAAQRKPEKTVKSLGKLLDKVRSQVLCTHRPVLPLILPLISARAPQAVRKLLPTADPFLEPGGTIVLQQPAGEHERIVSIEIHAPFAD
ncbi:NUDIX hydrolase [Glutamicibacter sp. MNS18]|uniref:NUDIX hydrolase n=1 Tax=Glutamicibacter sp. MNS18 TaxID=2989817 RepID=UPI002235F17B|nr:NUDIX hydrolase [Glutamicibacter sp. MNS18]MCW4464124.1 NUDIX hydrolase [Glutamicibacter sp. MNS18]